MFIKLVTIPALFALSIAAQSRAASQKAMAENAMRDSIALQKLSTSRQRAAAHQAPSFPLQTPAVAVGNFDADERFDCGRVEGSSLASDIQTAASDNKLPQTLVEAVIQTESAFHPCAVSSRGALGLMQLMPETASSLGLSDPFDARANLAAGSRYLGGLLGKYSGDVGLALAAYNAGPGAVDRYNGIPPYNETRDYVQKVMALWQSATRPSPRDNGNAAPTLNPISLPVFGVSAPPIVPDQLTVPCLGLDPQDKSCSK